MQAEQPEQAEHKVMRPRGVNQEHALRLAIAYCTERQGVRDTDKAIKQVRDEVVRGGGKAPDYATMWRWVQGGVKVEGYPELAQPFVELAKAVDRGDVEPDEWKASLNVGDALIRTAHDDSVRLLQGLMKGDEYKEVVKKNPQLHLQAMGKLTEALKARNAEGGGDVWEQLDRMGEEDALKAVYKLLERYPVIIHGIHEALREADGDGM